MEGIESIGNKVRETGRDRKTETDTEIGRQSDRLREWKERETRSKVRDRERNRGKDRDKISRYQQLHLNI